MLCNSTDDACCVISTGLLHQLVLKADILRLAIATRNNIGAYDEGSENKRMHFAANR